MTPNTIFWRGADLDYLGKRAEGAASHGEPHQLAPSSARASGKRYSFTLSSARVDRMGDTIRVDGWDLSDFQKNPIALWGHSHHTLPIGRWERLRFEGGKLKADLSLAPTAMAAEVAKLIEARVLKAVSVGFVPGEWKWRDKRGEGIEFVKGHQLLEASVVNIPANPDALLEAPMLDLRSFTGDAAKRQRALELIKLKAL